jgi:hypothetical protein
MMTGFDDFRDDLARHVPGLPAGANRSFDVTRHGLLDHVQRVLLRSFVLDACPNLAPEAIDAVTSLGAVWEQMVGTTAPLEGQGPLGRSAAAWQTARVQLAPLDLPVRGLRWQVPR